MDIPRSRAAQGRVWVVPRSILSGCFFLMQGQWVWLARRRGVCITLVSGDSWCGTGAAESIQETPEL